MVIYGIVTVMGIDIKPGYSPRSSREPRYAAVILRDGDVLRELDDVPLRTVLRLVFEYHVNVLAVDSIQEIARSRRELARLLQIVPSWCKLVEVTRVEGRYLSVQELAKMLKLDVEPTNPLKTAFVAAYAAYKGLGREVSVPPSYTYVLVTKGRSPSQGGASTERFKRSIRASVLQLVRDVKKSLDEAGLEYDLVVKKSEGGLERGLFIVYSPVEKVREVVRALKYKNARVVIKPAQPRIPQAVVEEPIILGVDPGTSIGIAALSFAGKLLLLRSLRTPDREEILGLASSLGKPIIVAVDTARPPEYVKKLASALNALIYAPERDLSVDEKQKIVAEYALDAGIDVPDAHARDALAAALKAYKSVKPLIDEVESKLKGVAGISRSRIVAEVLKGRPLAEVVEEEISRVLDRRAEERAAVAESKKEASVGLDKVAARLLELEATVRKLSEELKAKEEALKNLELELKLASKRDVSEECDRKISQLHLELDYLKRAFSEKSKLVEMLEDKAKKLEELLFLVGSGKAVIAVKNPSRSQCSELPAYFEKAEEAVHYLDCVKSKKTAILLPRGSGLDWRALRVPVVEVDVIYSTKGFVVVSSSVLEEVKKLWKLVEELEAEERRKRIYEMVKEYQESRRRTQ